MATHDEDQPRVLQVAVDCVEEKGGTPRAVGNFRRVLGGRIVSFTSPDLIAGSGAGDVTHLPIRNGALGQRYSMPRPDMLDRYVQDSLGRIQLIVVHGMYRYHAHWAAKLAHERRIPYWMVPHGALDPWVFSYRTFQKKAWMGFVGSRLLRESQAVLVATAREADKAAYYLAGCRVCVVHLPVERVAVDGRGEARASVRAQLGIPGEARILLYLGRLHPMKRAIETIEAFHKARYPGLHLVVVGPSSPELSIEECRARAHSLGAPNVHVVGPHFGAGKNLWLLGADGFISLSHRENFNYSAAEALSAGLPVILSPGNDLAPELASSRAGWLLESFAQEEEVEAIRQFGSLSARELAAMGAAGMHWASANLSDSSFAAALQQLRSNEDSN